MSKEDWGIKRVCNNGTCGAKFYDFHEKVISCPRCGVSYNQKLSSRSFIEDRLGGDEAVGSDAVLDGGEDIDRDTSDSVAVEDTVSLEDAEDIS